MKFNVLVVMLVEQSRVEQICDLCDLSWTVHDGNLLGQSVYRSRIGLLGCWLLVVVRSLLWLVSVARDLGSTLRIVFSYDAFWRRVCLSLGRCINKTSSVALPFLHRSSDSSLVMASD